MAAIYAFLHSEKQLGGWRFWLLWVLATNLGFFAGIWLGSLVSGTFPQGTAPYPAIVIRATVSAVFVGSLVGLAQSLVLNRHISDNDRWAMGTTIGWTIGVLAGASITLTLFPKIDPNGIVYITLVGFIAGAVVGIPQWMALRDLFRISGAWWIPVSSLGWGILIPGLVTGIALVFILRAVRRQKTFGARV